MNKKFKGDVLLIAQNRDFDRSGAYMTRFFMRDDDDDLINGIVDRIHEVGEIYGM